MFLFQLVCLLSLSNGERQRSEEGEGSRGRDREGVRKNISSKRARETEREKKGEGKIERERERGERDRGIERGLVCTPELNELQGVSRTLVSLELNVLHREARGVAIAEHGAAIDSLQGVHATGSFGFH